nr:hypothetical protein [Actinoplanes lutulentus]
MVPTIASRTSSAVAPGFDERASAAVPATTAVAPSTPLRYVLSPLWFVAGAPSAAATSIQRSHPDS